MRLLLRALALFAVLGVVFVLMSGEDVPVEKVAHEGYFKSERGDRVRAVSSASVLSQEAARAVFDRGTHTDGALSRYVFYSGASVVPGDALTLAPNLQEALAMTVEGRFSDWDWMILRNPAGQVTVRQAGD